MVDERNERLRQLCLSALSLSRSEREIFLDRECAHDNALRAEIESLISYESASTTFLESAPLELAAELLVQQESQFEPGPDTSDALKSGETVSHYKIVRVLGVGGMGIVYQAQDERLGRSVALKFLPEDLLKDDVSAERLMREARAASALNHPNICTVYDADEFQGRHFIVMEYLQGHTLKEEIGGKPLAVERTLDLAIQIASGLEAAHSAHIIHRDIKSANIFITERLQAKILDFGLAKITEPVISSIDNSSVGRPAESSKLPKRASPFSSRSAHGTVAYMSPEQVAGEIVDERTDLFSFGVVLYEMVSGDLPFKGDTTSEICDRIARETPVPVSKLNSKVPASLESIVSKALAKDRPSRYQTASELLHDLDQVRNHTIRRKRPLPWQTVTLLVCAVIVLTASVSVYFRHRSRGLTNQDTIVLADFQNATGEAIFDQTLKQALRAELEQSPFLNVLSNERVGEELRYMSRSGDTPVLGDVARQVCLRTGSKAVVEGSISRVGGHYEVALNAVGCQDRNSLGSEFADVDTRDRVVGALGKISTQLRSRFGESLQSIQKYDAPVQDVTTGSLEALQAYTLGMKARHGEGARAAIGFFKQALDFDPNFASAHWGLGQSYWDNDETELGDAELTKAFALRTRVSEKERFNIESSYYEATTGEKEKAIAVYQLWQKIYPRDPLAIRGLSNVYLVLGEFDSLLDQSLKEATIDPDNAYHYTTLANAYIGLNEFDKAQQAIDQAQARHFYNIYFEGISYLVAFERRDANDMNRHFEAALKDPQTEDTILSYQADSEAYYGHLRKAREFTRKAADDARKNGGEEEATSYLVDGALREMDFGNREESRKVLAGLRLSPQKIIEGVGALALARAGEDTFANAMADDLERRFPLDLQINRYWVPTTRAAIALDRRDPGKAVEILQAASQYELAKTDTIINAIPYPIYLRGYAFLALGQSANAATEFQKILDHQGTVINYPLGALAHLGLARAYAEEAGVPFVAGWAPHSHDARQLREMTPQSVTRVKAAYEDFFSLWKDADPDIPILKQAQAEYKGLNMRSEQ